MTTEPAPRRASITRRPLTWIAAAAAVIAAVALALLLLGRRAVDDGRRLVAEGRPREAAARFAPHASNPFVRRAARAGLAVSRAAAGDAAELPADAVATARSQFDLPALAEQALKQQQWAGAAALASAAAPDARTHVIRAAAALEGGDTAGARALLDQAGQASDELAVRVRQAVEWQEAGARTVVRDRDGRGLGWLAADGAFHPASPDVAAVLPLAALPKAARGAGAVRLAIDVELSRLALAALGSRRGSIVLLDPASGEILAAVSDPRTLAAEGGTPAFEQRREPASISKLVTSTATYRAGVDADRDVAQMTCPGHARYGGRELWCAFPAGKLSGLGHALAVSCNVAFANLGYRIGITKVVEELRRYGFDRPGGLVQWGRVVDTRPEALADLSIGLEATDITPVHGAAMGAVFVEGRLPEPALVLADDGMLGMSPRRREIPPPQAILDAAMLPPMRTAMEAVTAEGGTAEHLDVSFPVVMKTGTGATDGVGYHVNYVGAGPLPKPKVAFAIRVTHEGSSPSVNAAAREVTRALFEGLGQRFPAGTQEAR